MHYYSVTVMSRTPFLVNEFRIAAAEKKVDQNTMWRLIREQVCLVFVLRTAGSWDWYDAAGSIWRRELDTTQTNTGHRWWSYSGLYKLWSRSAWPPYSFQLQLLLFWSILMTGWLKGWGCFTAAVQHIALTKVLSPYFTSSSLSEACFS